MSRSGSVIPNTMVNRGAQASLSDLHNSFVGFVLRAGASGLSGNFLNPAGASLLSRGHTSPVSLLRSSGEPERLGYLTCHVNTNPSCGTRSSVFE